MISWYMLWERDGPLLQKRIMNIQKYKEEQQMQEIIKNIEAAQ